MSLAELISDATKVSFRSADGETLNLFVGSRAEARQWADQALRAGRRVEWQDGTHEWISVRVITGDDGELVFHEDGDRIRVNRVQVTLRPDGTAIESPGRKSWRSYDSVFGDLS